MRKSPKAAVVTLFAVVVTTGCGTTVPGAGVTAANAGPAGDGLGPSRATSSDGQLTASTGEVAVPATQVPALSGNSGRTVSGGTAGETDTATAGQVDPEGPTALRSAPGVTRTTIKVGIGYTDQGEEGNAAVGASGIDPGDNRDFYNALFSEVNKAGGIAGRRLVASYFKGNPFASGGAASQEQAACELWTRDDPVFITVGGNSDNSRACVEKNGLFGISSGESNSIESTFQRFPHYVEVSSMGLDRRTVATVNGLTSTDFYGKSPKIGIVAWDDPNYRAAVDRSMVPALKSLGFGDPERSYVKVADSANSAGESSAAINSAVLRFRSTGVDRVFIVDGPAGIFGGTGLTLLFIRSASSQQYFPRYGMNDSNSPQGALDAGLWSADDVRGSRAVTWGNTDEATDVGASPNAARTECLALMQRHGQVPDNPNKRLSMLQACDIVWFLRTALGTAFLDLDRDVLTARATAIGTAHRSPMTYRVFIGPKQRDGIDGMRTMALNDSCDCYRYTSGVYTAPRR